MLAGRGASGAWAEGDEGSAGAADAAQALTGAGEADVAAMWAAAAAVAKLAAATLAAAAAEEARAGAGKVWDEEPPPCDSVETAAEAWNCARLHDEKQKRLSICRGGGGFPQRISEGGPCLMRSYELSRDK